MKLKVNVKEIGRKSVDWTHWLKVG